MKRMVTIITGILFFILTFGLLIVIVAVILWFGAQELWASWQRRRYYRALYRDLVSFAEQEWEANTKW